HALKIELIKVRKASGVLLRSFDQKPLVRFFLQSLQQVLRGLTLHKLKRWRRPKGYARKKRRIPCKIPPTRGARLVNLTLFGAPLNTRASSCSKERTIWNRSPECSTR